MKKKPGKSAEQVLLDATLALYDCVLGERSWEDALSALLPCFNGRAANILIHDQGRLVELHAAGHAPMATRQAYSEYYAGIDFRTRQVLSASVGDLILDHRLIDDRQVSSSELYQDFLIPNGYCYGAGAKIAQYGALSAIFSSLRAREYGKYTDVEARQFEAVNLHMGRAIGLMWRFQGLERKLFAQAQALDALSFGVLVANGYGHVYHANHEAEQILRRISAIKMIQGRLRCGLSFEQTRLDQLLRSVVQHGISDGMRVRDVTTRQEWHLWAVPARDGLGFANERLAVIVITNPNQPPSLDMILQRVFGFTFAEVKLASALATGCTVADYAERECISITTARTHVRAILGKAGVKRQTDLLRMVASAGLMSGKY